MRETWNATYVRADNSDLAKVIDASLRLTLGGLAPLYKKSCLAFSGELLAPIDPSPTVRHTDAVEFRERWLFSREKDCE